MRPAPAAPPRHRPALAAVLSVLALAGCSRDLALPSPPAGPTVTGLSPAAAFAGQLLRVSGANFDADATSNTVHFAGASARGERFDGAALVVRVPADAGDGSITVANREGTSTASADPFDYLGLGELRSIRVGSASPILHHPRAVRPVGDDVVIDSALLGGLVWAANPLTLVPDVGESAIDAYSVDDVRLYYAATDPASGLHFLIHAEGASGAIRQVQPIPYLPSQIVVSEASSTVYTFHSNDLGEEEITAWMGQDLTLLFGPVGYGIDFFFGATPIGNGALAIAGMSAPDYDLKLWSYYPPWPFPATPPVAVPFTCTPVAALTCPPVLAVARGVDRVPLASATWIGTSYVAAALEGGDVAIAQVSSASPTAVPDVVRVAQTLSPAAIESMNGLGTAVQGLATKPDGGYSVAFSMFDGSLSWMVDSNGPTVTGVAGPLVYIANDADNDVVVANWNNGERVARVNFDVRPGGATFGGAVAWLPSESGVDGDLYFPMTAFPGAVRYPIGEGAPGAASPAPLIGLVSASAEARAVWFASGRVADATDATLAPPALWGQLGISGGVPAVEATVQLPELAEPQLLAAQGARVVVAHDEGLSLVDGALPPATADVAAVPGTASPAFAGLGFTPAGDVWTLVDLDAGAEAQLWAAGEITAGGVPAATWAVPGEALSAAWLEDGLWVFWEDGAQVAWATLLDGGLGEVRTVPSNGAMRSVDAVSPNGRLLAHRELGSAVGYHLRFFRADPTLGFPEAGRLIFDDRVTGFAFDGTGERLYVVTQAADGVVTVD